MMRRSLEVDLEVNTMWLVHPLPWSWIKVLLRNIPAMISTRQCTMEDEALMEANTLSLSVLTIDKPLENR